MRSGEPETGTVEGLPASGEDFRRPGLSAAIGTGVGRLRDVLAASLVALGGTPSMLTVAGFLLSACAMACLLVGAGHAPPWEAGRAPTLTSWWPLVAALFLTLACASDILDGAVARIGDLRTRFGALLDSTLDRFSDLMIYLGCVIHFSLSGNVTLVTLSMTAAAGAVLISYVKARAENFIDDCGVGYWQRGERCGMFLAACYFGHISAALWLLGTLPILTAVRRLRHAHRCFTGAGPSEPTGWRRHLMPWRQPRGSIGYDLCTGSALAFLLAAPLAWPAFYGGGDPLREWLERILSL